MMIRFNLRCSRLKAANLAFSPGKRAKYGDHKIEFCWDDTLSLRDRKR
jgi:hypothetical protein